MPGLAEHVERELPSDPSCGLAIEESLGLRQHEDEGTTAATRRVSDRELVAIEDSVNVVAPVFGERPLEPRSCGRS